MHRGATGRSRPTPAGDGSKITAAKRPFEMGSVVVCDNTRLAVP